MKQIPEGLKEEIDNLSIIVRTFNTPLSVIDGITTEDFNTTHQLDITDIYKMPKDCRTHALFKYTWNIFQGRPCRGAKNKSQ